MRDRIPTGLPALDEIVGGGLLGRRTYLVVGRAGTGKTILSLQWLLSGRDVGEKGLYITLAEPGGDIEHNVASFGWDLEGIHLLDLTPTGDVPGFAEEYRVFSPSEVEQAPYWRTICEVVEEHRPDRVVIDSLTQLRYLSADEFQFRKNLMGLVGFLGHAGCTTLVTFEPAELEKDTAAALAVDGIVNLRQEISPARFVGLRSLQVEKMRGTAFVSGWHPYRITSQGFEIYPHLLEDTGPTRPGRVQVSSGIAELDAILKGGLETGTATFMSGPTGVGKSTLSTQILATAAAAGRNCALIAFEESLESVLARCDGVGIPARRLFEGGRLKLVRVNTMEMYPDELLGMIRRMVSDEELEVVVVDSLKGYRLAMEEFGSPLVHIHNLITYLNRQAVTTIFTQEVDPTDQPLMVSDLGASHMADNILLLRYAEQGGRIVKMVGCLKKRLGPFEAEFRVMDIRSAPEGIVVGPPVHRIPGILSSPGVAVPDVEDEDGRTG